MVKFLTVILYLMFIANSSQAGKIEVTNETEGEIEVSILNRDPLSLHSVLATKKIPPLNKTKIFEIKEKQLEGAAVKGVKGDRYFMVKGEIDHKPFRGICGPLDAHLNYRIIFKPRFLGVKCISQPLKAF